MSRGLIVVVALLACSGSRAAGESAALSSEATLLEAIRHIEKTLRDGASPALKEKMQLWSQLSRENRELSTVAADTTIQTVAVIAAEPSLMACAGAVRGLQPVIQASPIPATWLVPMAVYRCAVLIAPAKPAPSHQ